MKKSTLGKWKIGLKHEFISVKTELIEREMETNNGTSATVTQVSIGDDIRNSFITAAQMDVVRVQYNLNKNVGVFISAGIAWDSLAEIEGFYGGGMSVKLFEQEREGLGKFYGILQGEYQRIDIEEDISQ